MPELSPTVLKALSWLPADGSPKWEWDADAGIEDAYESRPDLIAFGTYRLAGELRWGYWLTSAGIDERRSLEASDA